MLCQSLNKSLAEGDFKLHLQPKVRLDTGRVAGAEALVRWEHPQYGTISPGEFIPLFEKNGMIRRLDHYMFRQVCAYLSGRRQAGAELLPISVNLSRRHFDRPDFLDHFTRIAGEYQIPAGVLEFELTESILLDDQRIQEVARSIGEMHRRGFLCSLDDFGSGFSSLGLLGEFDVDAIKLDRRFFKDLSRPRSRAVLSCLLELAERLGAGAVAEGIETREQVECLREMGCGIVQGFVFSRPLPAPEFDRWAEAFSLRPEV